MNKPVRQHYYPKSCLNHFCDEYGLVHAYSKKKDSTFSVTPLNLCVERNLYTVGGKVDQETKLNDDYDSLISPILSKIISEEKISIITPEELKIICRFLSVMLYRNPVHLSAVRNVNGCSRESIVGSEKYWKEAESHGETIRKFNHSLLFSGSNTHFVTSDNPVAFHASYVERDMGLHEFLALDDARISFPISPKICWYSHKAPSLEGLGEPDEVTNELNKVRAQQMTDLLISHDKGASPAELAKEKTHPLFASNA